MAILVREWEAAAKLSDENPTRNGLLDFYSLSLGYETRSLL